MAESRRELSRGSVLEFEGNGQNHDDSGVGVRPSFEIAASQLCSQIYRLSQFVRPKCAKH